MKGPIAAGVLALGSAAYAQTSQRCQDNICYSLNIPDATASSGNGDIFFQITAPTSYQWVALGQGTGMSGANIFVMYTSSSGSNVTVSPRLGTGHVEPQHNSDAQITLLEGSGVSGDTMTANVRCSSCNSWSGGSQSFSSSAGNWIYAYKSGSAINSDDPSAEIEQHDNKGTGLSFDFSAAQGGSSTNPFASTSGSGTSGTATTTTRCGSAAAQNTGSGTSTAPYGSWRSGGGWGGYGGGGWGRPQSSSAAKRQTDSDDSCDDGSSTVGFGSSQSPEQVRQTQLLMAHGILAALVFVILFPMGAIAIRLLSFPGLVMLHAAIQIVAWILFITAFGLGVYIANSDGLLNRYHPIIGIVLFVLVFFQPILGVLHHKQYKTYQRRTFWSYGHIWLGRIIITLGMINGGLGLMLADNTTAGPIAYGVVAGVVWLAYVVAAVLGERKRKRSMSEPPKYDEVMPQSSETRGGTNDVPVEYYGDRHPTAK